MHKNICNFIPYHKDYHSIHTINFVLETKPQIHTSLKLQSIYKMHLVVSGKGTLHTAGKTIELNKGDIFFTFPGTPNSIESVEDFTYMYISFLGTRANMIMEKLKISTLNYVFKNCDEVYDYWKNGLIANGDISDLITESILLYTFYYIGNKTILSEQKNKSDKNIALVIKKYIDDNLSQQKLTLEELSKNLSYSPKYISAIFKKSFKIGITEYLNTTRIQNACTLMNQGFTNVSDIALRCGYTDAQYFSKVFKQKIGVSPKTYIKDNNES